MSLNRDCTVHLQQNFLYILSYINIFFSFQRGVAPLHLASRHGHAHLIRLLLDHGADVNLPSRGGVCGLHLSSRCGHANAVELLLDKGTIHIRDHPYITSAKRWVGGGGLHISLARGHSSSVLGFF